MKPRTHADEIDLVAWSIDVASQREISAFAQAHAGEEACEAGV
jgi:hypothetical protein